MVACKYGDNVDHMSHKTSIFKIHISMVEVQNKRKNKRIFFALVIENKIYGH